MPQPSQRFAWVEACTTQYSLFKDAIEMKREGRAYSNAIAKSARLSLDCSLLVYFVLGFPKMRIEDSLVEDYKNRPRKSQSRMTCCINYSLLLLIWATE